MKANAAYRLGQIVWAAVLAVLLVRWWLKEDPPRWFQLLLPVCMLGMSFSVFRAGQASAGIVVYLVVLSGVLMLAVLVHRV